MIANTVYGGDWTTPSLPPLTAATCVIVSFVISSTFQRRSVYGPETLELDRAVKEAQVRTSAASGSIQRTTEGVVPEKR